MIFRFTVPDETLPSWNKFYSGQHWAVRKKMADYWHEQIGWILRVSWGRKAIIVKPVSIHITCYFKNKRWIDADNLCGKLIIDALKGVVIKDDSPEYVQDVCLSSRIDTKNPRTEIILNW